MAADLDDKSGDEAPSELDAPGAVGLHRALTNELRQAEESIQASLEALDARRRELARSLGALFRLEEELASAKARSKSAADAPDGGSIGEVSETDEDAIFAGLIEAFSSAVFVLERAGGHEGYTIVAANPAAAAYCEKGRRALRGQGLSIVLPGHDVDYSELLERVRKTFRTAQPHYLAPTLVEAGEAEWWIEARTFGLPAGRVGLVVYDVSRQRAAEERRQQADKLDAIGRLAGGVAHDFNNLLIGLNGLVEIAREQGALSGEALEDLDVVEQVGARAASLTEQLLTFGRRQKMERVITDLNALLSSARDRLADVVGPGIDIELVTEPRIGSVKVDREQIVRVLVNLAQNAREAMPRGGRLTLRTSRIQVRAGSGAGFDTLSHGSYVRLSVEDTGRGVASEVVKHAFEPFFTTKGGGGAGLGLSTAYGIVRQHAGEIRLSSRPGGGARCEVLLPCLAASPATELFDDPAGLDERAEAPATVLVVDDNRAVRRAIERNLSGNGFQVLAAGTPTGAESLMAVHGDSVGLMLVDLVLPDQTGLDLVRSLRQTWPELRVLFMSGYGPPIDGRRSILEPGIPFIAKPFSPQQLLDEVRKVLDAPAPRPSSSSL